MFEYKEQELPLFYSLNLTTFLYYPSFVFILLGVFFAIVVDEEDNLSTMTSVLEDTLIALSGTFPAGYKQGESHTFAPSPGFFQFYLETFDFELYPS